MILVYKKQIYKFLGDYARVAVHSRSAFPAEGASTKSKPLTKRENVLIIRRFSARHGVPHAPRGAGKAGGDKSAKHRKKRVTDGNSFFAVRARFELAEPKTGSAV